MNKSQHGYGMVEGLLILIIVGLIGFVGWYVWTSKEKTDVSLKKSAMISQNATPKKTSSNNKNTSADTILTVKNLSNACQSGAGLKVCGEVTYIKDIKLSEIWVMYGLSADNLDKASNHISPVLADATGDTGYVKSGFNINYTDLASSTKYYFKVLGSTATGSVESEIGSFTTTAN